MAYSAAQNRANQKWLNENRKKITITIPKELGEQIKAAADAAGLSVNAYIQRTMEDAVK